MKLKRIFCITALLVAFIATPAMASHGSSAENSIWVGSYGRLSNWKPVARDELIVWSSPSRAYLVKIWPPFRDLRFAHAIGVTETGGSITKFDQVIVAGHRVPIKSIQRIDSKLARSMTYRRSAKRS